MYMVETESGIKPIKINLKALFYIYSAVFPFNENFTLILYINVDVINEYEKKALRWCGLGIRYCILVCKRCD